MWWREEEPQTASPPAKQVTAISRFSAPKPKPLKRNHEAENKSLRDKLKKLEDLDRQRSVEHKSELSKARQKATEAEARAAKALLDSAALRTQLSELDNRLTTEAHTWLQAQAELENSASLHAAQIENLHAQYRELEQSALEEVAEQRRTIESEHAALLSQHHSSHQAELTLAQQTTREAESRAVQSRRKADALRHELAALSHLIESEKQERLRENVERDNAAARHASQILSLQSQLKTQAESAAETLAQQRLVLQSENNSLLAQYRSQHESDSTRAQQTIDEANVRATLMEQVAAALRQELTELNQQRDVELQERSAQITEKDHAIAILASQIASLKTQLRDQTQSAEAELSKQRLVLKSEFNALLTKYQSQRESDSTRARQTIDEANVRATLMEQVAAALRQELTELNQQRDVERQERLAQVTESDHAIAILASQIASLKTQLCDQTQSADAELSKQRLALQSEFNALLTKYQSQHESDSTRALQTIDEANVRATLMEQVAAALRQELTELNQQRDVERQERLAQVTESAHAIAILASQIESLRTQLRDQAQAAEAELNKQRLALQSEFDALLTMYQSQHESDSTRALQTIDEANVRATLMEQVAAALRQELTALNQQRDVERQERSAQITESDHAMALLVSQIESLKTQLCDQTQSAEAELNKQRQTLHFEFTAVLKQHTSRFELEAARAQLVINEVASRGLQAQQEAQALQREFVELKNECQVEKQQRLFAVLKRDNLLDFHASHLERLRSEHHAQVRSSVEEAARKRLILQTEFSASISQCLNIHQTKLALTQQTTRQAEQRARQAEHESVSLRSELVELKVRTESEAQAYRISVESMHQTHPPTVEMLTRQLQLLQIRLQREAAARRKAEGAFRREASDPACGTGVQNAFDLLLAERTNEHLTQQLVAAGNLQCAYHRKFKLQTAQLTNEIRRLKDLLAAFGGHKSVA